MTRALLNTVDKYAKFRHPKCNGLSYIQTIVCQLQGKKVVTTILLYTQLDPFALKLTSYKLCDLVTLMFTSWVENQCSSQYIKWILFQAMILQGKAMLDRGQPGLLRWILLWIILLFSIFLLGMPISQWYNVTIFRQNVTFIKSINSYRMYHLVDKN